MYFSNNNNIDRRTEIKMCEKWSILLNSSLLIHPEHTGCRYIFRSASFKRIKLMFAKQIP